MRDRYLLDTNVLSQLIRNPEGVVAVQIERVGPGSVCTSIIVAAEIQYGAAKSGSQRLAGQVSAILASLDILPFETPADVHYGALRATLERAGMLIGPNDLLIAAHVLALGCTLVTDNEREFSRVTGLRTENWLRG